MNFSVLEVQIILLCLFLQAGVCLSGMCSRGECECSDKTMVCKQGNMPKHLPLEIRELLIERFNFDTFNGSQRTNGSMIQKLDITADRGTSITSKRFEQFSNLTYLGLHGKELRSINQDIFHGLTNLLILNLSSNPFLTFDYISRALNAETELPSLTSLSVSNVQMSLGRSAHLDDFFFRSIATGRNLTYLDVSYLNIASVNFSHFEPLCNSLNSLDIKNSIVGRTRNIHTVGACASLRMVDMSGLVISPLRLNFSFENFEVSCSYLKFLFHVESLIINSANTRFGVRQGQYFLNMSMCPLHIRKVSIAGNKIQWVNMTVKLHEETERTLSELNVSNNGLEYLSPLTLKPSENVRILDLSNNKLSVMQEKYTKDFENLFWAQTKLHYLNFSHNSLSKIPMQTFSKNKHLKVLDISYNNIESLDFAVKQLVNIEKLIVSHNRIYTIEYDFRIDLQMLLSRLSNSTLDGNDIFYVYLEGNPFECTCDKGNMRFLEWLHATDIIDENETLTCNLDENLVDVRGNGLAETKHFCRMQNLQKIASISTPLVSAAVIICIIFVFLLNRRHRRKLIIREVVAQIEMGIFPLQHLAFLSHCSEDTDLVMSKIYPELCEHLSEITRSKEELVCIGDRHFRPGFALREEVMRCVENSSVFLAIISRNFCRKAWCNLEIGEAYDQNKPIIMLMTEHVEKELMDYLLQKMFDRYTHATWIPDDNGGHVEPEWKIFCNSIIQLAGKSTEKHVKTPAEKKCLINSTYRS